MTKPLFHIGLNTTTRFHPTMPRFERSQSRDSGDSPRGRSDGPRGRSFDGGSRGRGGRSEGRDSSRFSRDKRETTMTRVTCDACGKSCEVPFKPTGDKPVHCSDCFRKTGGSKSSGADHSEDFKKLNVRFDELNEKIDRLISSLDN